MLKLAFEKGYVESKEYEPEYCEKKIDLSVISFDIKELFIYNYDITRRLENYFDI